MHSMGKGVEKQYDYGADCPQTRKSLNEFINSINEKNYQRSIPKVVRRHVFLAKVRR